MEYTLQTLRAVRNIAVYLNFSTHYLILGDHIRVIRGATESNPHGTYDHHMLVIAVIDDVTIQVIHYTGEVADAAADSAVTSFGSFGSFGGGEDIDCEGSEGAAGGGGMQLRNRR